MSIDTYTKPTFPADEASSIDEVQGPLERIEQIMFDKKQTSGWYDTDPLATPRNRGQLIALGSRIREIVESGDQKDSLRARLQAMEEGY